MATRYEYDSSGYLVSVISTSVALPNTTDLPPIVSEGFTPQFVNGAWLDQANPFKPGAMPMSQFLVALTSVERAALRASADPLIKEFVIMCDRFDTINTALPSVQFDVNYAAGLADAPAGAANAGEPCAAPPISGGADRVAAILSGNPLAATS